MAAGPEIDVSMRTQVIEWRVERVAAIVFALVFLGALGGLFGGGPLSSATARGPDITVAYERFIRWQAPTRLTISLHAPPSADHVDLRVAHTYLESFQVQDVSPDPAEVLTTDGWDVYRFSLGPGAATRQVVFDLTDQTIGSVPGRIGVAGSPAVHVGQFAYP